MIEQDGQIRLSWQQFIWGLSIVVVTIATYYSLAGKIDRIDAAIAGFYTKREVDQMKSETDRTHYMMDRRLDSIERDIQQMRGK